MLEMQMNKENKKWVQQQMSIIPVEHRQRAREGYERVYWEAYEGESVDHKKKNAAVRAANTRLREFIEKVS